MVQTDKPKRVFKRLGARAAETDERSFDAFSSAFRAYTRPTRDAVLHEQPSDTAIDGRSTNASQLR